MRRVQAGDEVAFEQLCGLLAGPLQELAGRVVHDRDEVQDVMQDAYLALLVGIDTYDAAKGSFDSWLYAVARNAGFARKANGARSRPLAPEEIARRVERSAESFVEISDERWFRSLLAPLTEAQRRVLVLAVLADLSPADIAAALDRTPQSVRHLQSRALRLLRARLAATGGAPEGTRAGRHAAVALPPALPVVVARRAALCWRI